MLDERSRSVVRTLWKYGPQSRWELHERLGISPNAAGEVAGSLMVKGLLSELPAAPVGSGRPRVRLTLDSQTKHVLGVALSPGMVEIGRVNLLGGALAPQVKALAKPKQNLVDLAAKLLEEEISANTLAVGLSVPGFMDHATRQVLMSAALPGRKNVSLSPIASAAGGVPVVPENDMHALGARWLLSQAATGIQEAQDVLLVLIEDGRLGAAILMNGRPSSGCVMGGNELGHCRFPVPTEVCYCGRQGCLERIVSSKFITAGAGQDAPLALSQHTALHSVDRPGRRGTHARYNLMFEHLVCGLSNAANFLRLQRMVIVSPLPRSSAFNSELIAEVKDRLLSVLATRITIEFWEEAASAPGENAAWLGLAEFILGGWPSWQEG